jgi:hypothetical protein
MEEAGLDVNMQACPMAERFAHFIRSAGPVIVFVTPDHPEGLPYAARWRSTMLRTDSRSEDQEREARIPTGIPQPAAR